MPISWSKFQYNTAGSPLQGVTIKGLAATKDGSIIATTSSGTNSNYLTYKLELDSNGSFVNPTTWQKLQSIRYDAVPNQSLNLNPSFRSISNLYSSNYIIDPQFPDANLIPSVFASLGTGDRSYQIVGLSGENIWICDTDITNLSSTLNYTYGDYKELRKAIMVSIPHLNGNIQNAYNPYVAFIFKINGRSADKIQFMGLTGYSSSVSPYTYQTNYWRGMQGAIIGSSYGSAQGNFKSNYVSWNNSSEINGVMLGFSNGIDDIASNYPIYYLTSTNTSTYAQFLLATSYSTNAVRKVPMSLRYNDGNYYETSYITESGITGVKNITYGNGYFVATPYSTTNKIFFTSGNATGWKHVIVSGIGNIDFRNSHTVFTNSKFVTVCDNYVLESQNPSTGWSVTSNGLINLKQDQNFVYSSITGRQSIYAGVHQDGSLLIGTEKVGQSASIKIPSELYPGAKVYLPQNSNVGLPLTYSVINPNILKLDSSDSSLNTLAPGTAILQVSQAGNAIYDAINQEISITVSSFTPGSSLVSWNKYSINLSGVSAPYQLSSSTSFKDIMLNSVPTQGKVNYVTRDITKSGASNNLETGWAAFSGIEGVDTVRSRITNGYTVSAYQQPDVGENRNSSMTWSLAYISNAPTVGGFGPRGWKYHGGTASQDVTTLIPGINLVYPETNKSYSVYTFIVNNTFGSIYMLGNLTVCDNSIWPVTNKFDCMDTTLINNTRLSGKILSDGTTNALSTTRFAAINIISSKQSNKISAAKNTFSIPGGWDGLTEPVVDNTISGISSVAYDDGYDLFMATSNQTGRHVYYSLTGDAWGKVDVGEIINFENSRILAGQGKYTIFAKDLSSNPIILTASSPGGAWNKETNTISFYSNQNPVYVDNVVYGKKSVFAATTNSGEIAYSQIKNLTKLTASMTSAWQRIPSSPQIGAVYSFSNLRTNDVNQTGVLSTTDSSIISVDNINRTLTINKKGSVKVSITTSGNEFFDPLKLERVFFPKLSQVVSYNVPSVVNVGSSYSISLTSSAGLPLQYSCSDPDFLTFDLVNGILTVKEPGRTANITISQIGNDTYDAYVATYPISSPKGNQTLTITLPSYLTNTTYDLPSASAQNIPVIYNSSNSGIAYISSNNKLNVIRCGSFNLTANNSGNVYYNPFSQNYSLSTTFSCTHTSTAYIPSITQINSIYELPSRTNADRLISYSLDNSGIGKFLYSGTSSVVTGLQITGYGAANLTLNASGDSYYPTYNAFYSFNSYKTFQTFNWPVPSGIPIGSIYVLSTGTNVGLPITYSSSNPPAIDIVSGNYLVAKTVGAVNIFVTAPGSALYEPLSWITASKYVSSYKILQTGSGFRNVPRITPIGSSYLLEEFTNAGIPIQYSSSNSGVARIRIV